MRRDGITPTLKKNKSRVRAKDFAILIRVVSVMRLYSQQ